MTPLRQLVAHAIKAPSSHNTQPWRFRVEGSPVAVFADRTRALPVNDPHDTPTREAPILAVLGTAADQPADWLRAGQALERLLLTGAMAGLQAGYLNQPCQVAELRPRLGRLIAHPGFPQLCLHLGFAVEPGESRAAAPRSRRSRSGRQGHRQREVDRDRQ